MRITDVKRAIGCGINKAYRCLNELIRAGYAKMVRGQSRVDWFFYDVPQTSAESHCDGCDNDGNGGELINKNSLPNTEINNYEPAINQIKERVVVLDAGALEEPIPIPPTLKGSQAKAASKILRNVTESQAALILIVFNAAMQNKRVNNPIGYLHQLVKASQDGTLTAPAMQQQQTLDERITRQREALKSTHNRKIDNDSHFAKLRAMFGSDGVKVLV